MLPSRSHGGPDETGTALHDFSTNSNAVGPCPPALQAVGRADAGRYPDPRYIDLRRKLATFHEVSPERIVLAASGSEWIVRLTAATVQLGVDSVWMPLHCYGDYAFAAAAWRLPTVGRLQPNQLRWCAEPSNPHGASQPGLDAVVCTPGGIVVLDRAYEPLRLGGIPSLSPATRARAWELWSPNKALGLTGVRAAYAVAPEGDDALALAERLERLAPSWPLGAHGVALLEAWCEREVQWWLTESLVQLRAWKVRQLGLCHEMGWHCLPGAANFFCARMPGIDVAAALRTLRSRGIKLRDCTSFNLPGHVRAGVLPPASQDALAAAWRTLRLDGFS